MDRVKSELVRLSRLFYERGWALATSGNFSARIDTTRILITASGKDKGTVTENDIVLMNLEGEILEKTAEKPSAETHLHCEIYKNHANVGAVLHTHSVYATVLSMLPGIKAAISLRDYEMLKALDGVSTHQHLEHLPVFPNDQDIVVLARSVHEYWRLNPAIHGFLIAGHGLYTWGHDLASALRHVEAFEFLLECEYRKLAL